MKKYSLRFVILVATLTALLTAVTVTIILNRNYNLNYRQLDPRCHPDFIAKVGDKQCNEAREQREYLRSIQHPERDGFYD